jgi:hypothetical protein
LLRFIAALTGIPNFFLVGASACEWNLWSRGRSLAELQSFCGNIYLRVE